jgi:antitoxin CptB
MTDNDRNRMLWASRRGMLELDLVLEPFARDCYDSLEEADKARYRALVACEDQDLFAWFLRREVPADEDLRLIVGRVLAYARAAD